MTKKTETSASPFRQAKKLGSQNVEFTVAATVVYGLASLTPRLTRAEQRKIARLIGELPASILPANIKAQRAKAKKGK